MTIPAAVEARAADADLTGFAPKPTALTPGLVEAGSALWSEGAASAGFWECSPGTFSATRDGYTEVCEITAGRATVQTEGGGTVEIGPGSTLVMPAGWRGTWTVHEQLRKLYVIVPAAD